MLSVPSFLLPAISRFTAPASNGGRFKRVKGQKDRSKRERGNRRKGARKAGSR